MKKILLDTNALMAIAEFKIDLFSEISQCCSFHFQLQVPSGVIKELEKRGWSKKEINQTKRILEKSESNEKFFSKIFLNRRSFLQYIPETVELNLCSSPEYRFSLRW